MELARAHDLGSRLVPTRHYALSDVGAFQEPRRCTTAASRSQRVGWGASGRRVKSSRSDQLFPAARTPVAGLDANPGRIAKELPHPAG